MTNDFVKTIIDLLNPYQLSRNTSGFAGVPHDEILEAYRDWLQYLKLLVKEPFTIQFTQGLQDEGVDVILECLNSNKKIGFQIKSHNDLKDEKFRPKIMSQITYSKKHCLEKLFVILCADLQNKSQSLKVHNMVSQISQMQDDYVLVIEPEKAYPVYECYKNKKHPLVYLGRSRQIIDLICGLSESLSTKDCAVEISAKFNYIQQDGVKETYPFSGTIKFKQFSKNQQNNPLDKFARLQYLGERVEFTKDDIDEVVIKHPGGREETVKPDHVTATPEKPHIGPLKIYHANSNDILIENIILYKEYDDHSSVRWKTNEESGPWSFEIIGIRDKKMINFHMSFEAKKGNYKDVLIYLKLFRTIKQNKKIALGIDPAHKQELPIKPNKVREVPDEEITMVENLIYIQEKLSQEIPITDECVDPVQIQTIKNLLKNGQVEILPQPHLLSGQKYKILDIIDKLKKQSPLEKYEFTVLSMMVNIGGISLELPPIKATIKNVVLDEDIDKLERKIASLQSNENITFTLKSTTNENIIYEIVK